MNELRSLKKVGTDKFELRTEMKEADLVTIKGYKRVELREIYGELKLRRDQSVMQKHKLELDIKKLDVDDSPALREFADRLDAASRLLQKDKVVAQLELVKKDVSLVAKQMKEISIAVPEVLRDK